MPQTAMPRARVRARSIASAALTPRCAAPDHSRSYVRKTLAKISHASSDFAVKLKAI
jgi:hypothetical protein